MTNTHMVRRSISVRDSRRFPGEEGGEAHEQKSIQVPVMLDEVVKLLAPKKGEVVVDATYGSGGHSRALQKAAKIKLIALDADPSAGVLTENFADLKKVLSSLGVGEVHKVLFDLGWRREQLASGRGFSFLKNEPLDMSYGVEPRSQFRARDILNSWSEQAIADVLFGYGEERYARRIAKAVVARRKQVPIGSTLEFVEIIRDAVPSAYRHGRLHFATKSFQALRVAVNDELRSLEAGLSGAWAHLACGGRIAVISFHSIEDRIVKKAFVSWAKSGKGKLVVKKPLTPSFQEVAHNPASRSAKLRVIEKICKK